MRYGETNQHGIENLQSYSRYRTPTEESNGSQFIIKKANWCLERWSVSHPRPVSNKDCEWNLGSEYMNHQLRCTSCAGLYLG